MNENGKPLLGSITSWILREPAIQSAVLFGSSALTGNVRLGERTGIDFDLHIIGNDSEKLERIDWSEAIPDAGFRFQAVRPATGSVRKVTALFDSGQLDLVIIPTGSARLGSFLMWSGFAPRFRLAMIALNEMATCLRTGYLFLKGEKKWGAFYARVHREMGGVRLDDAEICQIADAVIVDFLWILHKIKDGEIIAAQHVLHRQLSESNLRLYRELRLRRNLPLPSFGLGRRIESLATNDEVAPLRVNARSDAADLTRAAIDCMIALKRLMAALVPTWTAPEVLIDGAIEKIEASHLRTK